MTSAMPHGNPQPGHSPDTPDVLRPYQREAVDAGLAALRSPDARSILHLATGGGKTRVGNEIVVRWLGHPAGRVVWITKDWPLLRQAARDLVRRHPGLAGSLRRIGCGDPTIRWIPVGPGGRVVYTTLQTLVRRLDRGVIAPAPTLLVWDEVHWGEGASSGRRILRWCGQAGIPVLGLTATPRPPDVSAFRVVYSRDFASLVADGWLAKPVVLRPVRTGTTWSPRRDGSRGDFDGHSLARLGADPKRNRRIVTHYLQHADAYGRTIIFACSIEHADLLARMLVEQHGVSARVVHSRQAQSDNDAALRMFTSGEVRVLVNVAMLTHGVDLPETSTVLLARPTLSEILFAQMVGRGARRHEASGKRSFYVVEFTDNVSRFGDQLVTAKRFFVGVEGLGDGWTAGAARKNDAGYHRFDPAGAPVWIPDAAEVPEALRGLWYRESQTFGVEIELTCDNVHRSSGITVGEWEWCARRLHEALSAALPGRVAPLSRRTATGRPGYKHWSVAADGTCGWEVRTPILEGRAGFEEVDVACRALSAAAGPAGLKVDWHTGLHVHLGWDRNDPARTRCLLRLVRLFEPALATLVAPSRLADFDGSHYDLGAPNEYCKPVAASFSARRIDRARTIERLLRAGGRYVTLNVKRLRELGAVEVRLHSGTVDSRKVLLWVSLWQQILWAASRRRAIPRVPECTTIRPSGDILRLADLYLPNGRPLRFLQRLHERRLQVRTTWDARSELAGWHRLAGAWQPPRSHCDPHEASVVLPQAPPIPTGRLQGR